MKKLFDSSKNPIFRLLCRLVNEINFGAELTRKEIKQRILRLPEFIYAEAPETEKEDAIIDALFDFDENGHAKICLAQSINLSPNDTEINFLKTMLLDDEVNFLLPPDLRKKLSERLKNFSPLYNPEDWKKLRLKPDKNFEGKIFSERLAIVTEALRKKFKILRADKTIIPCRLEYDFFADKYFLIAWSEEKNIAEKISVHDLEKISLTEEKIFDDVEAKLKNFYAENYVEISLSVKNTRNAVERCFALFGSFDKKTRFQEDGTYFLLIKYCRFDESEVLEKILSLGAAVTVLSPQNIRKRIIKKFVAIKDLYQ